MKIKEQWIMWEPLSKLRGDFYIESVIDDYYSGFKIIISDHNNKGKKFYIKFKLGADAYRSTDELYAWAMQKDFLRDGSYFYKVINSKYIQWLSDISNDVSKAVRPNMQHFVIVSQDSTLELLNGSEPEIEFINES